MAGKKILSGDSLREQTKKPSLTSFEYMILLGRRLREHPPVWRITGGSVLSLGFCMRADDKARDPWQDDQNMFYFSFTCFPCKAGPVAGNMCYISRGLR